MIRSEIGQVSSGTNEYILYGLFINSQWFVSSKVYQDWQDDPVLTTIKTTTKPIRDIDFPSITICGQGTIDQVRLWNKYWIDTFLWHCHLPFFCPPRFTKTCTTTSWQSMQSLKGVPGATLAMPKERSWKRRCLERTTQVEGGYPHRVNHQTSTFKLRFPYFGLKSCPWHTFPRLSQDVFR